MKCKWLQLISSVFIHFPDTLQEWGVSGKGGGEGVNVKGREGFKGIQGE